MRKFIFIKLTFVGLILWGGFLSAPLSAVTLSEVLEGMMRGRFPETLSALSFSGDFKLNLTDEPSGLVPMDARIQAVWVAPDIWQVMWEGMERSEVVGELSGGHPALDHAVLSRPDFVKFIDRDWTFEYQGTAVWDREPAWQILVKPADLTSLMPPFRMYVRKDDYVLLRTEVNFGEVGKGITDMEWVIVEGVVVPSRFVTRFAPSVGPLAGYETAFYNHKVNGDFSELKVRRFEGSVLLNGEEQDEKESPVFEELYHGFADSPIVAPIVDSSGVYDRVSFTFSLYVEDPEIVNELKRRHEEIRAFVQKEMSGREWSGEDGLSTLQGKWKCGEEIREALNKFLGTESITDFYFLEFIPLERES